jgi:hypothetical protein
MVDGDSANDVLGLMVHKGTLVTSIHRGILVTSVHTGWSLVGRGVVINGLVAKPELNGHTGTAVSFDYDKGRYSVELDDDTSSFRIKPCNLLLTVCRVAPNLGFSILCQCLQAQCPSSGSLGRRQTINWEEAVQKIPQNNSQDDWDPAAVNDRSETARDGEIFSMTGAQMGMAVTTLLSSPGAQSFMQDRGISKEMHDDDGLALSSAKSNSRGKKQRGAGRAIKDTSLQVSPEEMKKQEEDADRAMRELLEEEEKTAGAPATASQKKKQAQATKKKKQAQTATKFGNLSVGGGERERNTGLEAGSGSGEGDDVFKNMDAECKVCMQETKVRHPVSYLVCLWQLCLDYHGNHQDVPHMLHSCHRGVCVYMCVWKQKNTHTHRERDRQREREPNRERKRERDRERENQICQS